MRLSRAGEGARKVGLYKKDEEWKARCFQALLEPFCNTSLVFKAAMVRMLFDQLNHCILFPACYPIFLRNDWACGTPSWECILERQRPFRNWVQVALPRSWHRAARIKIRWSEAPRFSFRDRQSRGDDKFRMSPNITLRVVGGILNDSDERF